MTHLDPAGLRILPHSEEAEKGVLGSILLSPDVIGKAYESGLTPEAFYDRRHQALFSALSDMRAENITIDAITIGEWLKNHHSLDKVGGYDYLVKLQDFTMVPSHITFYSEIVLQKKLFRNIIEGSSELIDMAYKGEADESELIQKAQSLSLSLSTSESNTGKQEAAESIKQSYQDALNGVIQGIPTPFPKINKFTGGAPKGLVTLLAGRSGKGKSFNLAGWYEFLGSRVDIENHPSTIMCFEDGIETTMARMASKVGKYSHRKLMNGQGKPDWIEWSAKCLDKVVDYPIEFVSKKMTIEEIRNRLYTDKEKRGIELAVIDGFKDIKRPGDKYNDTGYEEYLSQELTDIARRLDISIVVVMHLTKIDHNVEITKERIRGSGQIVSDCRVAWALQDYVQWRPEEKAAYGDQLYETDEFGNRCIYAFEVLKINNGIECRVPVRKNLDIATFTELTKLEDMVSEGYDGML